MDSTHNPPNGLLDAALFYAGNGIPVLPLHTMTLVYDPSQSSEENPHYVTACDCSAAVKQLGKCAPAKHPISVLVPHGVLDATLDEATIRMWWGEWPEANIGGALGPAGLIDVAPDSVEWWAEFTARGMPPTAHFASGGGDGHEHWLYLRGDLPRVLLNKSGEYDIMTAGYAVMPPSMHKSGNRYRWLEWLAPVDRPSWLDRMVLDHYAVSSVSVDEVIPATDVGGEPPVPLTPEQVDVWEGHVLANDRSNGLVEIARMLGEAGFTDVERMASILAARDIELGWHKYTNRKDGSLRYREIAVRYGRPVLKVTITGKTTSAPTTSAPREKTGSTSGWMVAHTVREERDRAPEEVDWLIEGWLGKGMMTELVAKVKLGKTTFAMEGLRAFIDGDDMYCGQRITRSGRVLYITEEGRATFHEAMQRYGLWKLDDEFLIVYDFEILDHKLDDAVGEMIRLAEHHQVDVVVIDTLTTIAGLDDEDNSGRVGAAMREFRRIANAGFAVWTLRHGRKIGGEVGDAGRGSSAISGAVDILLQLDPWKGDDDESNLRVMRARGRMKATPTDKLTLEFDKETEVYRLVGQTVSREARLAATILSGLEELGAVDEASGKTSQEITLKIGKRLQSVREELKRMTEDGQVRGGERRTSASGSPAKIFWLPPRVHLTPEKTETVVPEPSEPRTPEGGSPPTSTTSAPILFLRSTSAPGSTGPAKREKTPEAIAKAAEKKAALELERLEAADAAAPTLRYLVVPRDAGLGDALTLLDANKPIALDTETTGLNARTDRLRTIQLSDGATHIVIDVWAQRDLSQLDAWLVGVEKVVMHTYLFDMAFLAQAGVGIDPSAIYDVRTAAMVLESKEDWTDFRLQGIAKRHLQEHVSKKEQKRGWDAAELRHAKLAYAAEDARVTHAAAMALQDKLAQDADVDGLWNVLALERDVQQATWWLASAGAPADAGVMREAVAEQEAELAARLEALNLVAGAVGVNWRSPKQVLPILIEHGLDLESTSEDALMDAESDAPIVDALLRYRSAGANLGLLRKAQASIASDGRIYASFNPIGAQTGRTSCSDPNLQNLPRHTRAREAIRPPAGRVFVRADYAQLQIVIAAWIAQDAEMIRILNEPGGEVHQRTADAVGCTRDEAKAVNFGFLFGAGAETFRREQRKHGAILTLSEAAKYRETFMRTYRGIRSWHRGLSDWGVEETIIDPSGSGRRRSAVVSKNVKANTPVQMVEAHGFKRALQALYEDRAAVPSARLVMMVHDELIAECDAAEAEACGAWLKRHMTYAMQPLVEGVTVGVDATIVASYSDEDKKRGRKV